MEPDATLAMPVSTFSSDSSTFRRNSSHDGQIDRWNTARDGVEENERKMSLDEINEMDGSGMGHGEHWPLDDRSQRSVSPETVVSRDGSSLLLPEFPRTDEAEVTEDGVVRKSEDIAQEHAPYPDRDEDEVSDLDNKEGHVRDAAQTQERESPVSSPVISERQEKGPEVPPVRDEGPSRSDTVRRVCSLAGSPSTAAAQHPSSGFPDREQGGYQRAETSQPQQEGGASALDDEETPGMNGTHQISEAEIESRADSDGNVETEEVERETATPIPFGTDGAGDSHPLHSTSSQASGRSTPLPSYHNRQRSIQMSTPPQRSGSRRSAHIPHNKDRVRYSWQSVQDEEPNRPRIHIIKLVSNTATASAGFPQGEAFGFSISPNGRRIAAYNSARLYILQTAALPVGISQDYALKRRPLAVELVDEGNILAILADEYTVNIYDLGHQQLRLVRTVKVDFSTNCIALAPTGGLLAAAYEGGVEIFSLDARALPTDRRSVRSQRMDRLTFSQDGATLLGTTTRINVSSTVTVSVPVFPSSASGVPTHEELKEAWCSELLHPENIRNSSHATFMRENRETCNDRLFAWNGLADTFGILNISDMQYGNIDFPVVISPPLSTCGGLGAAIHACPAIDEHGDTAAMIVNDRTIRLYIVPHKADDDETTVEAHSIDHELDEGYGCPFTDARWVYSTASLPAPLNNQTQVQGRLVVTSPGGVVEANINEESVEDVEGGRIILFDFDPQFAGQPGQTFSLTLGKSQPQLLEEPEMDVATEVAIVRRRTVNQSKGGLSHKPITLGRAATTFGGRSQRTPRAGSQNSMRGSRASMLSIHSLQSEATRSLPELVERDEANDTLDTLDSLDTFEEPYAQNAPRSQASLQRAASNAQRHRYQALEEKTQQHVHADSTGGFLALPEYTEEPNAPLPSRFRAMAGLDIPAGPPQSKPALITSTDGDRASPASSTPSSAPPALSEGFSGEQAFHAATEAQMQRATAGPSRTSQSPTSPMGGDPPMRPVARSDTFQSIGPLPRSLQRAYGMANTPRSPIGTGPPPNLIGDWQNVSPIVIPNHHRQSTAPLQGSALRSGTLSPAADTVPEEDPWDAISPMPSSSQPSYSYGRPIDSDRSYRYSTSGLNPPGHASPERTMSSSSSYAPSSPTSSSLSSRTRRLPPHMQAFRNAAVVNASASLFPPMQPSDHVPIREPASSPGSVPHRVTAWHPPAPSSASTPLGSGRGHSRKSSLSNKSAFASTTTARNLGFFSSKSKRKKKNRLYGPEFTPSGQPQGRGNDSMMETRSVFTFMTRSEGKCTVM